MRNSTFKFPQSLSADSSKTVGFCTDNPREHARNSQVKRENAAYRRRARFEKLRRKMEINERRANLTGADLPMKFYARVINS